VLETCQNNENQWMYRLPEPLIKAADGTGPGLGSRSHTRLLASTHACHGRVSPESRFCTTSRADKWYKPSKNIAADNHLCYRCQPKQQW